MAVVLFTFIWIGISKVKKNCLNRACKQVKERGLESSNRFLVYAIISFTSMLIACILSLVGLYFFEDGISRRVRANSELPHLPPVSHSESIPAPSDEAPYTVPANIRSVSVPAGVVNVERRAILCETGTQTGQKAKELSASCTEDSSKEMSLDLKGVSVIKKDIMPGVEEAAEFFKTNKSVSDSTLKSQKPDSIGELGVKIASQRFNSLISEGQARKANREDCMMEQSKGDAQETKEQSIAIVEHEIC